MLNLREYYERALREFGSTDSGMFQSSRFWYGGFFVQCLCFHQARRRGDLPSHMSAKLHSAVC